MQVLKWLTSTFVALLIIFFGIVSVALTFIVALVLKAFLMLCAIVFLVSMFIYGVFFKPEDENSRNH